MIEDSDTVYFDGNSLGRLPKRAISSVRDSVEHQWGDRLVRAWGESWVDAPLRIGNKAARLIGASEGEVIVCDSTSVNLFKLICAALRRQSGRHKVVSDDLNFPSDLYVLEGAIRFLGVGNELEIVRSKNEISIPARDVEEALDKRTAVMALSHASFKSGFLHDMSALTRAAHRVGALVIWDLSHSVGVIPIDLHDADVDMAVGCTYKYLNGGPGSPAFLYVRKDLQEELGNPIWAWFGERNPFDFELEYRPADGIKRFLAGTPPILSLLAVESGIDLILKAGLDHLRQKSMWQTEFLIELWDRFLREKGVALKSPTDSAIRGSHVSFGHAEALAISLALIGDQRVIPDFRQPDNLRFGIAPMYNTYSEIVTAVERLLIILQTKSFERYRSARPTVT